MALDGLHELAQQTVMDLCAATGMRARFGVLVGGRVAYIEKRPDMEPITSFSTHATLPAHASAAGKAILAFTATSTVTWATQNLRMFTSSTLHTPDQLRRELETVRLNRVAVAVGELTTRQCDLATPVFGRGGVAVAALELELPDLHAAMDTGKAVLAVAARGLARQLTIDRTRQGQPGLRLMPDPDGGIATSSVAGG